MALLTGVSTRPSGSDSYWPPVGTKVAWRVAQPIQDLMDQDVKYTKFGNLGIVGNLDHLKKHGGHTPWRSGSKRGIIWAKDTECPHGFLEWLLAKCRSNYDTMWLRFFNCDNGQYDPAGNYLGYSADHHFHAEVQDGHENQRVTLFDDFMMEMHPEEFAMNAAQEAMLKRVDGNITALMNMLMNGVSPTGNETTSGGQDRIYLFDHMDDDRDAVNRKLDEGLTALSRRLNEVPNAVKLSVAEELAKLNINVTPEQQKQLVDGIVAGVNRPMSGTWSTNPEV